MPYYEYECEQCDMVFGVTAGVRDCDSVQRCPLCDDIAKKIISTTSFVLKGAKWEKDGYGLRKEARKAESKA